MSLSQVSFSFFPKVMFILCMPYFIDDWSSRHIITECCFEISGGSRGGAWGAPWAPSLFWVKKEEMTEGRKAGWASKIEPSPLLSSKSGSATGDFIRMLQIM